MLSEKIFPAVCALLGALVGALPAFVTPWVLWGMERSKLRHQARKETIDRWRAMVMRVSRLLENEDFGDLFLALYADPDFLSLEPHLSSNTRSLLDGGGALGHQVFASLLADIATMEKGWGIL
ncbi:hypothetical protein ACI2UC_18620 [Ralstonia nicotianae]